MERVQPLVERNIVAAEIDRKESVVQVVEEVGSLAPIDQFAHLFLVAVSLSKKLVVPRMPSRGTDAEPQEHHHDDQRVHGNDKEDQDSGEEDQVLDRMHRNAGPRTKVDVAMMHVMRDLVERLPMDEPMCEVEVRLLVERHEKRDQDK